MSDEEIIEVVSVLKANDKTMKDSGISDNLWAKAVECIMFLQSENAKLRARLNKTVEFPCKVGDSAYYIQNGKIYYGTVICSCFNSKGVKTIGIDLPSLCIGENMPSSLCIEENEINKKLFFTIDEAKFRLAELKGEK